MIQAILRAVTRPPGWLLARSFDFIADRRLGRRGMLELYLTHKLRPLLALRALEQAAAHPSARGVILHIRDISWGWATLVEWREALGRIRAAGGLVVAVVEAPGNGGYYLASAADRVLMAPSGELGIVGVGAAMSFFGPALEKVGVQFDVVAAGAYKSFGEQFTRSEPSPENREAMEALIDGLHADFVAGLAESRGMSEAKIQELIDRAPIQADEAVEIGLVDALGYDDRLDELLEELLGEEARRVAARSIVRMDRWSRALDGMFADNPAVAVVHLQGSVVMGDQPSNGKLQISAREVPPVLKSLAEHPSVKAVVIAIDSPGGSALASDIIWRSVELLKREKPVVAALGNVAASGGYYIASGASEIISRPSTLTGSIGVVGGKLVLGQALEKLGVSTYVIARGKNVGVDGVWKPFNDEQRERFRARLKSTYDLFLKRVSAGRRKPVSAIAPVAEGRVWTGRDAELNGLVDHLGGLEHAMARARQMAGLRSAQQWQRLDVVVQAQGGRLQQLIRRAVTEGAGIHYSEGRLSALEVLANNPDEALALMPMEIDLAVSRNPLARVGFTTLDLLNRWRALRGL